MERRDSGRSEIQCLIECKTGNHEFVAHGFDISKNGISFSTSRELPMNAEAILRYRLSDEGPLITARVRLCQQSNGRIGAQFIETKHEPPGG